MKKHFLTLLCIFSLFLMTACGQEDTPLPTLEAIPITTEESRLVTDSALLADTATEATAEDISDIAETDAASVTSQILVATAAEIPAAETPEVLNEKVDSLSEEPQAEPTEEIPFELHSVAETSYIVMTPAVLRSRPEKTAGMTRVLDYDSVIEVNGFTDSGYYETTDGDYIGIDNVKSKSVVEYEREMEARKHNNVAEIDCWAAIEADITLSGYGSGYHAKLVICTPTSAVSFGIQYDVGARGNYKSRAMCMVENIRSNYSGGQSYFWPDDREVTLNEPHHLMIALHKNGTGEVYLEGEQIGEFENSQLKNQTVYLRVEGCGRLNGDGVTAKFENIRLRNSGKYSSKKSWRTHEFRCNPTIISTVNSSDSVTVDGYVSGIGKKDWDSAYEGVSGIIQFNE